MLGSARLRIAIEEHGAGRQHIRVRTWPRPGRVGLVLVAVLAILAVLAGAGEAEAASILLASSPWSSRPGCCTSAASRARPRARRSARAFADVDAETSRTSPEPRRNLVDLAEQMRRSRVERLDVERVGEALARAVREAEASDERSQRSRRRPWPSRSRHRGRRGGAS